MMLTFDVLANIEDLGGTILAPIKDKMERGELVSNNDLRYVKGFTEFVY